MAEIMGKVEERTPYVIVAFQECERMNHLTTEIKRSLRELDLGLKGELTITSDMEDLENALFLDQVPPVWAQRAYPSLLGLAAWFVDLLLRIRELETWSTDFVVRYENKRITDTLKLSLLRVNYRFSCHHRSGWPDFSILSRCSRPSCNRQLGDRNFRLIKCACNAT